MKILNYITIIFLGILFFGCQEDATSLLDKEETNDIYEDQVFTDPQYATWFLNGVYREMNSGYFKWGSAGFLGNATDEGAPKANWDNAYKFALGSWGPTINLLNFNPWNKYYSAIRAANKFLENVDIIPDATEPYVNESVRQHMKGEAMFLRALFHYELVQHYGGVPIITQTLTQYDEELLYQSRATFDECVEFICSEAEAAAALLPHANEYSDSEFGRATKGAAWALVSRMRLIAASPLFNDPAKSGDTPWNGAYDPSKWVKAAEAARKVITETNGAYSLHTTTSPDNYGHYEDFFIRRYSPEVILSYQNTQSTGSFNPTRVCVPGPFFNYGHGVINNMPLLNVVADYEVVEINQSGEVTGAKELGLDKLVAAYESGQPDPETGFDPQDPYKNRDPRFYQSVWYNQVTWPARQSVVFHPWQKDPDSNLSSDGPHWLTGWTNTGFFHRKFIDPYANQTGWGTVLNTNHNYPVFRYAEILLNYAEALNEAFDNPDVAPSGYPMSVREAINQIRERAVFPTYRNQRIIPPGMPANARGESLPPLPTGLSKDDMRKKIRHERRIELAFEENRFWDIRRWKIGPETQRAYANRVYRRDDGSFRYDVEMFQFREWKDKYYLFPLAESEIMKNPNLEQNPGW